MPEIQSCPIVYRNDWFQVQRREGRGFDQPYYVVAAADYVTVLPVTTEGTAFFVRQYRPAVDAFSLELPSGHIDPGETPEQAATRELLEETGCETLEMIPLGPLASNTGRMSNRLWCFVARVRRVAGCEAGIELEPRAVQDIPRMIREAELQHALDLAVLMKAAAAGLLPMQLEASGQ